MSTAKPEETRISPKRTTEKVRLLTAEDLLFGERAPVNGEKLPLVEEIVIDGLLSFAEETRFRLGNINLLVGPNGSGKSNLIDCVRILRNAPLDIQETFKDSGFEDWLNRGSTRETSTGFLQVTARIPGLARRIRHKIRLGPALRSQAPLEEVLSDADLEEDEADPYFIGSHRSDATLYAVGSGRRRRQKKLSPYDPFQSVLRQIRDATQYPEITRTSTFYAGFRIYSEWMFGRHSNLRDTTPASRSQTSLSESMADLPLILNGLENTAAHEEIRRRLRELKETYVDYVTRIFFGRVGLELVESPFDKLPLPAKRLSDGTLRFLALASILLQPDPPPLVCLEEPELGMPPDMIRIVAEMIVDASTRMQMIITTHSEHLLTALQDDFDVLFAFDAGLEGSLVRRFSRDDFRRWRNEHALGELWTSGELGGNRW